MPKGVPQGVSIGLSVSVILTVFMGNAPRSIRLALFVGLLSEKTGTEADKFTAFMGTAVSS